MHLKFKSDALTPKVWFRRELWTVESVIRGVTAYILVSQPHPLRDATPGDEHKIFALIDTSCDAFFPDTPEVARLMKQYADAKSAFDDVDVGVAAALGAVGTDMFCHHPSAAELEDLQQD